MCVEFQRLKEKMGVTVIPTLPIVKFVKTVTKRKKVIVPNTKALELEKKLQTGFVPIELKDIDVDENGLLNIEGQKVVAYIRDQPRGIDYINKTSRTYRYHLCDCRTLIHMRQIGREKRYFTTKKADELFEVHDTSDYRSRKFTLKLELCKNCVDELKGRGMWFTSFSLEKYFEKYDSHVPETIPRIETSTETQNYSPNQEDISREYRKAVNFRCQKCGVDCSSEHSLLHLHHRNGDRSDYERTNLHILCVECHSKEPMHERLLFPQRAKDQVEMIKSLRRKQGIVDLGISL
jgi:5-methylcytosine-specific restriction endonuclease McrA